MIWQDIVIFTANLLFTYSLSYQVFHGFKSKKTSITYRTSGLTSIGLFSMGIAFLSLNLYFSAIIATFNSGLWAMIFIQRYKYSDKN